MTSLEAVLHGLKFMSKRSNFIYETKIPNYEYYVEKRDYYDKCFQECNGKAFFIEFIAEGIEEGRQAVYLACFDNAEDMEKFGKLISHKESNWSEENSSDYLADAVMAQIENED